MRFLFALGFFCSLVLGAGAASAVAERALLSQRRWEELASFDGKVSHAFFVDAVERIYAPTVDWSAWLRVQENGVWIETGKASGESRMFVAFSEADAVVAEPERRGFEGLRIALDPGHIGGAWGPVEERSFAIGEGPVLQEGDVTLAVSQRLAVRLRELGAEVMLTREAAEPVTDLRAEDFLQEAKARLGGDDPRVLALAERLFYRTAEIRARARKIEAWGGADLVLAIHVNATGFADPEHPELHDKNDVHVLVNGCYLEEELASPAQRLELLLRLFKGYHLEEGRVAKAMVESFRSSTGLPAYEYADGNAHPLDADGYLWARNLLANRVYEAPVVYLEPWQANGAAVYEWAAAGDYEGLKEFGGELRRSLPATYCEVVIAGLAARFAAAR